MTPKGFSRASPAALLLLLAAALLQVKLASPLGWYPSVVLPTLITVSFFVGFLEMAAIALAAALLLRWEPVVGPELLVLVLAPLLLVFFRKIVIPLENWLANLLSICGGLLLFYAFTDLSYVVKSPAVLLKDLGFSLLYGFLLFLLFQYVYRNASLINGE